MTSPHADPPVFDALLEQRGWVRALARRLARDEFAADDLEQDAWLAALRRPPRPGAGLGAWFARVVRNRASERHREALRAESRERRSARPEATPSTATLVEEAEAHRRVVTAVLALPEPLRGTVLLRFFEGLPPREIAARDAIPVETVRTRLKRAAELLREALGGERSGRDAWLGAVAPLLAVPRQGSAALPLAGGVAMKTSTKAALVLVLFAAAAAVVIERTAASRRDAAVLDERPRRGETADAGSESATGTPSRRGRTARPATRDPSGTTDASPLPRSRTPTKGRGLVVGRVVLPDGSPAVGAAVTVPPPRLTLSWTEVDPNGDFVLDGVVPRERAPVWVLLPGFRAPPIDVLDVAADASATLPEIRLVEDRQVRLRGVVRSTAGAPLAGATVRVEWSASEDELEAARDARDPSVAQMLGLTSESASPSCLATLRDLHAVTAADGSFALEVPGLVTTAALGASAQGHVAARRAPFRLAAADPIEFALSPCPRARGQVVDATTGAAIAGASVSFSARTDVSGVTEIVDATPADADGRFDLVGANGGENVYAAADGYALESARLPADGGPLRLALRRALSIGGRVVLTDGRPVQLAYVWIKVERFRDSPHDRAGYTDDDGSFDLSGLPAGDYFVRVVPVQSSEPSFRERTLTAVRAGTGDLRVVVDPAQTISGVVVDEAGRPVRGIYVLQEGVSGVNTDERGVFVLPGSVGGPFVLKTTDFEGSAGGWLPAEVRDVAAGATDVRIVLKHGASISGQVLDEDGRPVVGRRVITIDPVTSPFEGGARGPTASTDGEGRFAIRGLAEGTYRLKLDPTGADRYRVWLLEGESVRTGAEGLKLTLTEGGTIAGVVVDAAGTALPRVPVAAAWNPDDGGGLWSTTDEAGRFELRGLPPGRSYTVLTRGARALDVALGTRDLRLVHAR